MSKHLTVRDIENLRFQRREWFTQRIWWPVLGLVVLAGLLGVFSSGPLSETTAGGRASGFELEYERFVRNTGKATWTIRLTPAAVRNHKAGLFVSDGLRQTMQVESIEPAPSTETGTAAGLLLEWDVPRPGSPPLVRLSFRPDGLGPQDGFVRAGSGKEVPMSMFIYP